MKQIITKQGRTFDFRDILLFNVVNNNIVVILNDKEQLDKFSSTGNSNDAPIAVIPYSEEEFTNLVFSMKKIINYTELDSKDIRVEYQDGTCVNFGASNKEIVEENFKEQLQIDEANYDDSINQNENNSVGNWYDSEIDTESDDLTYEDSNVDSVEQARRFKIKNIEYYDSEIKSWKGVQIVGSITLGLVAAATLYGIEKINFISYDQLGVFMTQVGITSGLILNNMAKVISRKTTYQVLKEELEHELAEELVEEKSRGAK